MFGSGSKDKSTTSATGLSAEKDGVATTVIAKGTTIDGKFECSENVRLDGVIQGEVKVDTTSCHQFGLFSTDHSDHGAL